MFSPRKLMRELETRFSVDRALYVPRAALGLVAVLHCWRRGRSTCKVALPGAICHEVLLAVYAAGCEPIFCDVDVVDGLVREREWVRARSRGAEVAIVVHLYGNPAGMSQVRSVFPAPQCLVVDDAAQALGSHTHGGLCGARGDVGLLSFGATKHLSFGNAAVLFQNAEFAEEAEAFLTGLPVVVEEERNALQISFRAQLDEARTRLRKEGESAACAFAGLLDGMGRVLNKPLSAGTEERTLRALQDYARIVQVRISKAALWSSLLQDTGLKPVGMAAGCVPWRYVCRLPDIDWSEQQRLADAMRATGMHVSNWYLPAHWFASERAGTLPGVERLSREVFQFWVDDAVTDESIARDAAVVRQEVSRLRTFTTGM